MSEWLSAAALAAVIATALYAFYLHIKLRRVELGLEAYMNRRGDALEKNKRIRRRYIVFAIVSEKTIDRKSLENAIRSTVSRYFGEASLIKADPQLIYYEPSIGRGIIRTSHMEADKVVAALGAINRINGSGALIIPLKTTGTLKRAKKILYTR